MSIEVIKNAWYDLDTTLSDIQTSRLDIRNMHTLAHYDLYGKETKGEMTDREKEILQAKFQKQ